MTTPNAAESALDEIERTVSVEASHVVVVTAPGPCTDVLLGAVADRLRPGFRVVRLGAATGKTEDLWVVLLRRLGRSDEAATESGVVRALGEKLAEGRAVVLLRNADTASPATLAALGRIAAASGLLLVMACEVQDPALTDPLPALVRSLAQEVRTLRLDAPGQRAAIEQNLFAGPRHAATRGSGVPGRMKALRSQQPAAEPSPSKRRWVWFPIVSGATVASLAALLLDPTVLPAQSAPLLERTAAQAARIIERAPTGIAPLTEARHAQATQPSVVMRSMESPLSASPQAVSTRRQDTVAAELVTQQIAGAQSRAIRRSAGRLTLEAPLRSRAGVAAEAERPLRLAAHPWFGGHRPEEPPLSLIASREVPSRVKAPEATRGALPAKVPVSINAVPWARIEIDGDMAGVTPIGELPIQPGRHEVRAHLPDGRVIDRQVTLGVGGGHVTFDEAPF